MVRKVIYVGDLTDRHGRLFAVRARGLRIIGYRPVEPELRPGRGQGETVLKQRKRLRWIFWERSKPV